MATVTPVDTRRFIETKLIEKAWKDPEFRNEVIRDPKATMEKQLGQKLPDQLRVFIHEEDSNNLHFSIPPTPAAVSELSDEELERVAGGTEMVSAIVTAVVATGLIASGKITAANGW